MSEKRNFRAKEAAKYLSVAKSTIWLYAKEGKLSPIKLSKRVTIFKKDDLDNFIKNKGFNMNTISNLKQSIDIVELIGNYTSLKKVGDSFKANPNPLRDEKTASLSVYPNTQRYYDFGSGEGGDIIDFIKSVEKLQSIKEAIYFLQKKYSIRDIQRKYQPKVYETEPIKKQDDDQLIKNLTYKSNGYLKSNPIGVNRWSYNNDLSNVEVAPYLRRFFESSYIPIDDISRARYLFNYIIGYDNYFDCSVIIIRDTQGRVVDIVKYRPHREGYSNLPKYLYTKSIEKPHNSYLYPLETKVEKLIDEHNYVIIGEGLKNIIDFFQNSTFHASIKIDKTTNKI